jgi:hypothetical protein
MSIKFGVRTRMLAGIWAMQQGILAEKFIFAGKSF